MNTHMTKARTSETDKMSVTREPSTFVGGFQPFGIEEFRFFVDGTGGEEAMVVDGWSML
jgi:hypothetical protein